MQSYNKIHQSYRPEVENIYDGQILVEEKIDGSQFRIEVDTDGKITCGSHHTDGVVGDGFALGVKEANEIFKDYKPETITTIFCEYLSKPKQNSLPYERVPPHNIIIFDIKRGDEWVSRRNKEKFADKHGLLTVPLLWEGDGKDFTKEKREELLKCRSILGHGAGYDRVEGIVVKNYDRLFDHPEDHSLHGCFESTKYVNETFKEKNHDINPNRTNKFEELKANYKTDARLQKAVQHLKERGLLQGELSDLRLLIPEVHKDIVEEEEEGIKNALWKIFSKELLVNASKGMPEYYKKYLEEST